MQLQMMRVRVGAVVLLALAAAAVACEGPAEVGPAAEIVSVRIDDTAGPVVRTVEVVLKRRGTVGLTYGADDTPVLIIESNSDSVRHRITLPRLRAERSYRLEIESRGRSGRTEVLSFTTGALPDSVAALTFTETGTPTFPVSLIEIVTAANGWLGMLLVENGEIVGYRRTVGSLFGTARRGNGDIVLLDPTLGLVSYRHDGSIAHRLPQPDSAPNAAYDRIHHDVITTPRNTLLFIANDIQTIAGQNVTGEALWEWSPEAGTVVKRWSAFDHLRWPQEQGARSDPSNWLHGNGLAYGPSGNLLFSLRNIDQVISIAPDFSRVDWRMGGPGATLSLASADQFLGQHGLSATATDRVLMFDNGFLRPGTPFSRAIEYRIDAAAKTATRVWEYRPSPDIYAALVGSTRRLYNGNTVILFGMLRGHSASTGPIVAVEVDSAGAEHWRLTAGPAVTRLYRVTPVGSLAGEGTGVFRAR